MEEKYRAELEAEAEQGRKWQAALDALSEFCDAKKLSIVSQLETARQTEEDTADLLAELRVLRDFGDLGRMFVEQGKLAQNKLREGAQE